MTHQGSAQTLIRFLAALLVGIAGLASVTASGQDNNAILFRNAHVIVGDGNELSRADVLVQENQIVDIGSLSVFPDGVPIRVIDLAGRTLMPALIDAHAHLGFQSRPGWGAEHYSNENLILNLKQYAYYGFAAVFSAGSDPDVMALQLQSRIESGELNLPRFLFAAGMAPPGEGPNNQFLVHTNTLEQETGMTILRGLASEQQAADAVREVAEMGYEFIKLWVDDRGGSQSKLSPDLYRAVAREAQRLGLTVVVHQQYAADMPDLLDAGVNGFLHGRIGDAFGEEIAATMAARDVFVVPNLGLGELRREAIGSDPFLAPLLDPEAADRLSETDARRSVMPEADPFREQELRAGFQRIMDAGVDVVLGTDAGAVPDHPFGYTGHRELEIFVRLGLSPMDALVAATGNAARHLHLNDMGLIREGFSANLLILEANPLEDIRNTRRIHSVYLEGKQQNRTALRAELVAQE